MGIFDPVIVNTGSATSDGSGFFNRGIEGLLGIGTSRRNREAAIAASLQAQSNADRLFGLQQQKQDFLETSDAADRVTATNAATLAQSNADRLFNQSEQTNLDKDFIAQANLIADEASLEATEEKNLQTAQGRTVTNPKTGETFSFNTDSGKFDIQVSEGIDPLVNNTKLITVTDTDSFGNKTTRQVPVDKRTGQPIDPTQTAVGTQRPALSQNDKLLLDTFGADATDLDTITTIINDPNNSQIFGQLDQYTNKVSRFVGTDLGIKSAEFNAASSKLATSLTAQLSGALTDKDMELVLRQIPSEGDSPAQAKAKLAQLTVRVEEVKAQQLFRLQQSNPDAIQATLSNLTKNPRGYKLVRNKSTGKLSLVKAK